jgi:methyl-accepting chemotaxis protein
MRRLSLRQKFNIGIALAVAVSLFVLLGNRYLAKSAHFHYLERQHLAQVMQVKLAMQQAEDGKAPPKSSVLRPLDGALEIAGHVEYELFTAERVLFRVMGYGELIDLPYEDLRDLNTMRSAVLADPGQAITQPLAAALEHDMARIERNAERFAPLTAEAVGFIRTLVLVTDIVGAVLLLAVLWLIRRSVLQPLDQALSLAGRIAHGDLTADIEVHSGDEMGRLMAALRDMQGGLAAMVAQLRRSSESLERASTHIAHGNEELGARTEDQASALEQTAASMEQLGAVIRQNAASAAQADRLAGSAREVANQGGEAVTRVVDTMKGIHEASRAISEIVGLIDSIAFQTNILALNAAVEAARAGEQGRGFAVVAGEVRTLAGRCTDAARQVRTLIDANVQRVEQGAALVGQAGDTMGEVVGAIRQVSGLIGEISAASSEQSAGVAQVGAAVAQIDRVTQQNAGLVGELADAAGALKKQAQELVGAMAVFKVQAGADAAPAIGWSHRAA